MSLTKGGGGGSDLCRKIPAPEQRARALLYSTLAEDSHLYPTFVVMLLECIYLI